MTSQKPLRLYFIRHGQTENFKNPPFNGWRDAPLTTLGHKQLETMAEGLKGIPFDAVYSSDLSRAVYGGTVLAQKVDLELQINPEWREISFGRWEGWTYDRIKDDDADLVDKIFSPNGGSVPFPDGESYDQFQKRISKALSSLAESHGPGQRVALVCHAGVCKMLWSILLKLEPHVSWGLYQDFAAVNVADIYQSGRVMAHLMNGYLGPEGYYQNGPGFDRLLGG